MTSLTDIINKKRQQTADKKMGHKRRYKFKNGTTTVRILPSWRNDDPTFFHNYGESWIKDMDNNVLAVVGDRQCTFGETSVIRSLIQKAMGEARTDGQREHYKEMLAGERVLVNLQVLDDSSVDPNVAEIGDFSQVQFDNILADAVKLDIVEEFLDPTKGIDLIVEKTGSGFKTRYSFTFARKSREVPQAVLDTVVNLDDYIRAQFVTEELAVNAIKSLTASTEVLSLTDGTAGDGLSSNLGGDSADITDAQYDILDEARTDMEVEVRQENLSDEEVAKLFG